MIDKTDLLETYCELLCYEVLGIIRSVLDVVYLCVVVSASISTTEPEIL